MNIGEIEDVDRLKRINAALVRRVESSMDQQVNAFSLFQTAINLEGQVRQRTDQLTTALRTLERSNQELARQKRISEEANQSKTRFLAAASHDVLQPLHAAQLTISALYDVQKDDRGVTLVRQVERSLDTMHELLSTLLDISRLDAGVMVPEFQSVSVAQVVETLMSDFRPLAAAKGLKLKVYVGDEYIHSDKAMLRRALQNLIANAIRYTETGGIVVGTRKRSGKVLIEVFDTGPGIPKDQHKRIFEEFQRCSAKYDADGRGGLGLGLAIVHRLVNALGHEIELQSAPGSGSRFRILAGIAQKRASLAPDIKDGLPNSVSGGSLAGRRVLLIENDPAVIQAMSTLLDNWECTFEVARNRAGAMEILGDGSWEPDIIVADQHLDNDDLGTETCTEIRARLGRDIPVVIATAEANEAIQDECEVLGVEYMSKPIKPAQMRALLCHLIDR